MASGNLPALAACTDLEVVILTDEKSASADPWPRGFSPAAEALPGALS